MDRIPHGFPCSSSQFFPVAHLFKAIFFVLDKGFWPFPQARLHIGGISVFLWKLHKNGEKFAFQSFRHACLRPLLFVVGVFHLLFRL